MRENQVIPEAAVEAAMGAMLDRANPDLKGALRAALEAAAPHMLREAWNEGFAECKYDDVAPRPNPYRIPR